MITLFDRLFLINHQLPTSLLKTFSLLSDPKLNLLILGVLSIYLFIRKGVSSFSRPILYLFACTGFIMFFCGILKICVGRARPFLLDEGIAGFFFFTVKHSYLSFPSSHAALAMCFTRALQKRFSLPLIFYLYPIAIGASRVLLFAHFASDVVAGLLVGIVVERLLSIYYERFVESIKKLGSPKAS